MKSFFLARSVASLALSLGCLAAAAQSFPNRPIHIVVPFAPGGGTDLLTRVVAQQMSDEMKQQVVVENKPGAGGALAAAIVAAAPADGYTLYVNSSATAMMPSLYKNLSFDPIADFAPIALIGTTPFILIMNNNVPAKSLGEMIALAKAKPDSLSYGSAGNGSVNHVGMELFKATAGVQLLHIPYKGSSAALADVIGGQVTMMLDTVVSAAQHVKRNSVRALGISSLRRSALAPELPTIAEQGVKDFDLTVWYGFVAPKGVPAAVAQKLNAEVNKALTSAAVRERFAALGAEPSTSSTEDFGKLIQAEEKRWTRVVQGANIRVN